MEDRPVSATLDSFKSRRTIKVGTGMRRLLAPRGREKRPYQPVDEVLNWPSTHNMSRPKLRMTTLCRGLIAEQRLRQRAVIGDGLQLGIHVGEDEQVAVKRVLSPDGLTNAVKLYRVMVAAARGR